MFGKSKFIFIGVCLVLGSMALAASRPLYTAMTYSLIGKYEVRGDCSWYGEIEVVGRAEGLEILFDDTWGGVVKTELHSDRKILKFDLENALYNDYPDPEGVNIVYARGVIYPKKMKKTWVPQITLYLDLECNTEDGEYRDACKEEGELFPSQWTEGFERCIFVRKS